MGKRAERGKARVKQRAGLWLYRVMWPGERIVAGVRAEAAPFQLPVLAIRLAALGLSLAWGVLATIHLVVLLSSQQAPGPSPFMPFLVVPAVLATQLSTWLVRPVFIAVTDRQVICYRLSFFDQQPSRLLFAVPLAEVRVTRYRQGRWFASLRCEAPEGGKVRRRRLTVARVWQPDLDALLTALTPAEPATLS